MQLVAGGFRTKTTSQTVLRSLDSVLFNHTSNMDTSNEKIRHILQFFLDKDENACQVGKNVNNDYGPDSVTG